ncbi:Hypothetical protein I596_330 [Dokdonella koreensis DS-123]|uniref:Uncharacterized protein n=1 Tax=Dokdonella koreensis DS-123 TaxID=1300342 RepID=A0A167GBD0_9GAMM|nr:Hypothetical protein I596_330 [Dokdonella koreensis DS-123]
MADVPALEARLRVAHDDADGAGMRMPGSCLLEQPSSRPAAGPERRT